MAGWKVGYVLFYLATACADLSQMRRENVILVVVVQIRLTVIWRGEVHQYALAPWRLVLPRGQVVPEGPGGAV